GDQEMVISKDRRRCQKSASVNPMSLKAMKRINCSSSLKMLKEDQNPLSIHALLFIELCHGQVSADGAEAFDHLNGFVHKDGEFVDFLLGPSSQNVLYLSSLREITSYPEP